MSVLVDEGRKKATITGRKPLNPSYDLAPNAIMSVTADLKPGGCSVPPYELVQSLPLPSVPPFPRLLFAYCIGWGGSGCFLKGISHKKITPDFAVVKYFGLAPQDPYQSARGLLRPKYLATATSRNRYPLEEIVRHDPPGSIYASVRERWVPLY